MRLFSTGLVRRPVQSPVRRPLCFALLGWLILLLGLAGCGETAAEVLPTPTLSPEAFAGKAVFEAQCASCHSLIPDAVIVGPSLAGIATRADGRVSGQDARTYLYTSILRPGAYVVDGFENLMPENFGKKLAGEEVDALVIFLQTLE